MKLGTYTIHNSSINVKVTKIHYQTDDISKITIMYFTKSGIFITLETVEVQNKNIQHWIPVC